MLLLLSLALGGEQAKALNRLYDEVRAKVKTIVDHADPEGLLALGCPEDEYDDAVGHLTPSVLRNTAVDKQAIERWFGQVYGAAPVGVPPSPPTSRDSG